MHQHCLEGAGDPRQTAEMPGQQPSKAAACTHSQPAPLMCAVLLVFGFMRQAVDQLVGDQAAEAP